MNEHLPYVTFWLSIAIIFGTYNLRDIPKEPPLPNISCPKGYMAEYYKGPSATKYNCEKIKSEFSR